MIILNYEEIVKQIETLRHKRNLLNGELNVATAWSGSPDTKHVRDAFTVQQEIETIDRELKQLNIDLLRTPKIVNYSPLPRRASTFRFC